MLLFWKDIFLDNKCNGSLQIIGTCCSEPRLLGIFVMQENNYFFCIIQMLLLLGCNFHNLRNFCIIELY